MIDARCACCRTCMVSQSVFYLVSGSAVSAVPDLTDVTIGDVFPAYISSSASHAGIDKKVMVDMRTLFNEDVRPEAYSKLLLER